jgi:hypothetical protein
MQVHPAMCMKTKERIKGGLIWIFLESLVGVNSWEAPWEHYPCFIGR